ncbi:flagellar hook capping protein [Geobacter metallireducens RCH3]|uniref:hypothetical protein n=1 Tax=Geobacter metallireducens TaxID=28232 RepID=UPI00024A5217|nr:hypothetical protein [Geobacter metallireducens]EHP85211.1 flagellar hook capping protein [Geobacter metallireducens RCH3]
MKIVSKTSAQFLFVAALGAGALTAFQLKGTEALAYPAYFTTNCAGCHAAPVAATCNGCHHHGPVSLKGATNKTSYAPGESVSVTISGGSQSGWVRAILYDQNNQQVAISSGNDSGMGHSTTFPATLSAPAPTVPGTYTWKAAWFGNSYDSTNPTASAHGEVSVNTNSFTVVAPVDTTVPVVSAFTLPATSTSLTVAVSSFTATDNVGVTGYLITTSATAPAASATGWSATAPTSVTAVAGSNTFYAWAKDAAGNVSLAKSASVTVTLPDTVVPVVSAFTLPATATSLTVAVSSFTATDNVGVTGYLITKSATAPAASATGWTATAPTSVTAVAGSNTFYAWAKDAAGNVSLAKSASVTVTLPDATAPVVSAFTLPATSTSLTVAVSSFTATDNVGVTGYLITKSATAPAASATGWTATAPTSVTAVAGNNTFYAWAKDAAGNVSLAKSASVTVTLPDTTAPVVSAFTLPATSTSLTVAVSSFTATDNVGVTGYLITTSATAPAASATGWSATAPTSVTAVAGNNTFYAWAKDAAGNVSLSKSASVTVTVAPADLTLTISALANGSYTNKGTLNISGVAIDAAGIKSVTVNGQTVTVNPDGSFSYALSLQSGANTVTVVATDNAGTQKTDIRTITYDPAAPVLTVSAPADNSTTTQSFITLNGTISETSTVSVSVNGSAPQTAAISGNSYTATVYLVKGVNTISISATDLAGNITTAKRTVTYSGVSNNLALAVTFPNQDITTKYPYLVLKGTVVDNEKVAVKIIMDGKTYIPVVDDGVFMQRLVFTTPKLYAITVIATDAAGNKSTVTRNVIYRPGYDHDDD